MKYYLDEDLSARIAELVRAGGVDAISSHECGRDTLDDPQQLDLAAADGRCFVTRNRDDFIHLTVQHFEAQLHHAGILIVPNSIAENDFGLVARSLLRYAHAHAKGMQPYTIDFLSAHNK